MPELEPITREEMLLDGQDLEPITRKEMFIKRIYDKTQSVPEPITREEMFLKKAGDETTDVTIEQLNVSANGTYSESGKAYSPVIVNVPAPPIPDNAYLLNEVEGLPKDIATFTDGSNLPMPKLQVGIEPIQSGSGDPSPTNIRPIIGWTEANVTRTGKNLLPLYPTFQSGIRNDDGVWNASANTHYSTSAIRVKQNTKYTLSGTRLNQGFSIRLYYLTASGSWISRTDTLYLNENGITITTPNNCGELQIQCHNDETWADWQLEEGETKTTYESRRATYTIPFQDGDNPLTVYGGSLDVVSGELKVVPYYASYNGETLEGEWISDRDVYAVGTTPTIGAQVVNIGATPITYQLTPTQVKSLLGSNNVWCDTGKIEELEYFSKEV